MKDLKTKSYPVEIAITVVLFVLTACDKGASMDDCSEPTINKVSFMVNDFQEINEYIPITRTSILDGKEFVWTDGDTVGIYPNTGAQVYFSMKDGAGANSAEFDGGGWAFKPSAVYYSYYPFIGNIYLDRHKIPVSYVGQKQIGISGINHIGPYDYMYTSATSSENDNLNFSYKHLGCIIRPKLTLPAGNYTKLAITAPEEVFVKSGWFDLQSDSPVILAKEKTKQLVIDLEDVSVDGSITFQVYLMSAPVNLKGKRITISVLTDQKKEFQYEKTPSVDYVPSTIYGLACTNSSEWKEVPQSMGMIIGDWNKGGNIGGDAQ